MTSRDRRRQVTACVCAVLLAWFAFWLQSERQAAKTGPPPSAEPQSERWVELAGARLVEAPANDGDSFVIRHTGGEHTVRLYFADCCEKRRYELIRGRIADQAAHFGGISEPDVLRLGRQARDFTLLLLRERPFRVHTRWESVYDSPRQYAHVLVTLPDGSQRWLAELLIERGLARLHTKGAPLPDGTAESAALGRLREAERAARMSGAGGWGLRGRPADPE